MPFLFRATRNVKEENKTALTHADIPALFSTTNYSNIYNQTNNRPKHSLPLTNIPGFRMTIISISVRRFYSPPKRQY